MDKKVWKNSFYLWNSHVNLVSSNAETVKEEDSSRSLLYLFLHSFFFQQTQPESAS